jgi:hypothetical protein
LQARAHAAAQPQRLPAAPDRRRVLERLGTAKDDFRLDTIYQGRPEH